MRTRLFHSKFWKDNYIETLSPVEKLLFIYLLTNSEVNILFCYECSDKRILYETGCNHLQLDNFKIKVEKAGKIFFKDGYVFLKNANKYEEFKGELVEKGKNNILKEFSNDILEWFEAKKEEKQKGGIYPLKDPLKGCKDKDNVKDKDKDKDNLKRDYLLTDDCSKKLQKTFPNLEIKGIKNKCEELIDYCKSKDKRYKDYLAFARNAIRKDQDKMPKKQTKQQWQKPEITEEQRKFNLKALEKLKQEVKIKSI